ncbi:hypothetical protein PVAP13_5NG303281 [Panicum virgatum]|uniref:Retrovirus-related Pol polyprotein LINE-1 n=1 Tax=Panicum virgatum TaxID=38727 RepID=A0A8T0RW08_PANVG|nr:hypothetical protein PVAP13_5NG303281 [Panicum virgatum]
MRCDFGATHEEGDVSLEGQVVAKRDTFRYLGSMLQRDGDIDEDWRQASGVLCDKKVPQKLKGKFYRTAIRPAMLRHVQQLSVAEMRMLRWICGHTRMNRVRNDDIRNRLGITPIEEKLIQHQLRWFGHVQRRPPVAPVHSGILKHGGNMRRGRSRPKLTWEETIRRDLKDWSIPRDLSLDRSAWKAAIHMPEL